MTQPKVFVEEHSMSFRDVLEAAGFQIINDPQDADIIQLIGGADIVSDWYDKPSHPRTRGNKYYDQHTKNLYQLAVEQGKAILGVCRGGQFINAMQGGDMYQDVRGHLGRHNLYDVVTDQYIQGVNSIHHQMMIPHSSAVKIAHAVGNVCNDNRERVADDGTIVNVPVEEGSEEWEVLFYPKIRGLCFQAHPEYCHHGGPTFTYYLELLRRYLPEFFQ